ncbi:MAG: hypothetical protein U0237_14215 [Thermoleophilia bacterium]
MQLRSRTGAAALALTALALTAQVAAAAKTAAAPATATATGDCTSQVFSQALLPFGDVNLYTLAAQGSFEGAYDGWTVSGGGTVVADPAYASGPVADTRSLELAPGATATSPPICANATTPTFRFFTKALAAAPGAYGVEVTYLSADGNTVHGAASLVPPSGTWGLTPQIRVKTNKIAVDGTGWGRIRITIIAPADSALRIDDLYVDPKMR